jgi:YidC/Oxa1 family membrane protein insertase
MWLYELTNNYGVAVFLFALVVKVVLLYFSAKSKKSMMRQSRFTPYLKELEARYEGNKQKYQEEVAKLYKEEGINPMGGCLWSLLPFPILLALYRAIRFPITIMMGVSQEAYAQIKELLTSLGFEAAGGARAAAYSQIYESQFITGNFDKFAGISDKLKQLDYGFLGLDLSQQPSFRFWQFTKENGTLWSQWGLFLIPVIAALLSYLQSKISTAGSPQDPQTASTSKTMLLMMPLMSLWIGFVMPGALGLYWIATSVFQIIQDYVLTKIFNKQLDAEDADRNARLKAKADEIERKREETKRLREEGMTAANPNTSKRKMQKGEKQKTLEEANKWENANRPRKAEEEEPSRVGDRPFARGRAYVADRFGPNAPAETAAPAPEEQPEAPAQAEQPETPAVPEEIPYGENSITEGEIKDTSKDNGE